MLLKLNGRHLEITPSIRDYVQEKFGKIAAHFDQIMEMEITLGVINNPSVSLNHESEVTCHVYGTRIHVTERAESMYASIDLLADKLERQVRKTKEKIIGKTKESVKLETFEPTTEGPIESEGLDEDTIMIDFKEEE